MLARLRPALHLAQKRTLFTTPLPRPSLLLHRTALTPSITPLLLRSTTHRRFLTQEARDKISEAVKAFPIVLFMKGTPDAPQCGFSRAAIQVLQLHGVPHEKLAAYNVLEDPELRSGIKEFSEWPTIPQIYVNGEFIGGCDILLSMHQSGELETLLENNGIIPKTAEEVEADAASKSGTA